ncbi:MAG: GNAT family N-acetyltransferase [Bacteroidia bacterium]
MFCIHSERLTLIPLAAEHILLHKNDREALAKALGIRPSVIQMSAEMQAEMADAYPYWMEHISRNPSRYMWYTSWEIVHKQKNESIGGIGIASWPDAKGESMIGYVMDDRHHNQGFCTEALACLLAWMWQNPELKAVIADTPKENYPSNRVLEKNGFHVFADEGDLLHWRLERAAR